MIIYRTIKNSQNKCEFISEQTTKESKEIMLLQSKHFFILPGSVMKFLTIDFISISALCN